MSYFLSNPFVKGMVYQRLEQGQYDYILGMDIGHGESIAYLYQRGTAKVQRIQMNYEEDKKIPTVIRFGVDQQGNETKIIGRRAWKVSGFYQDFKKPPDQWGNKADQAFTYGQLMKAFIRTFWEQILQYNQDLDLGTARDNGKILIVVGCPSSSEWTDEESMKEYRELIMDATGCQHVDVMAESTASIMSAILDINGKGIQVNLNQGIAIFDAGSSTLDFTYIQLGQKMVIRSLNVAGYKLDEMMLEVALEKCGLARRDVLPEQLPKLLMEMRELKESFYPDQEFLEPRSIFLWIRNAGGIDKNSKAKSGSFTMDQDFMDEVLNRKANLQGVMFPATSWKQCCENFIQNCSIHTCDKVILTGGTSHVSALREAVEHHYGSQKVVLSSDPSYTVANGLCNAKRLEIEGGGYLQGYLNDTRALADKNYEAFINELSLYLSSAVCGDIQQAAANLPTDGSVTVGALTTAINQRVQQNPALTGDTGKEQVSKLFAKHFKNAEGGILGKANQVSANIYGATLTTVPTLPPLTDGQLTATVAKLNLSGIVNQMWTGALPLQMVFSVISGILTALAIVCMYFVQVIPAGVLFGISTLLDNANVQKKFTNLTLKKNVKIPKTLLNNIIQKMQNPKDRDKIIADAARKTADSMKKSALLKEEFFGCADEQAEILLGKLLFLVYEQK